MAMYWVPASGRLKAYDDGQLPIEQRRRVEAHLRRCSRCRRELDEIRFAAGMMGSLSAVEAPGSVWERIERALDNPREAGVLLKSNDRYGG